MATVTACEGPSCTRDAVIGGLCDTHYRQKRRGRTLSPIGASYGVNLPKGEAYVPGTIWQETDRADWTKPTGETGGGSLTIGTIQGSVVIPEEISNRARKVCLSHGGEDVLEALGL